MKRQGPYFGSIGVLAGWRLTVSGTGSRGRGRLAVAGGSVGAARRPAPVAPGPSG